MLSLLLSSSGAFFRHISRFFSKFNLLASRVQGDHRSAGGVAEIYHPTNKTYKYMSKMKLSPTEP